MLKFIFGRAATGKTSTVLKLIEKDVNAGKKAVLIIPEQFSFESEKAVLELLGDNKAADVSVVSFTRLCDELERLTGGICGTTLTDSDKLILMCRAINISSDSLKIWGRYKSSLGFARAMLETVDEFKINAVSAEQIASAAQSDFNVSLSSKLHDIGVIYSNFNLLLGERFIDPNDRLTKLAERLLKHRWFENKTVYLDSFKGFTGQQFKIIDRILSQACDVYVSLTNSTEDYSDFDIFENIRKTADRIKKYAANHRIDTKEDLILKDSHYKSDQLFAVEELLFKGKTEFAGSDGSVTVCRADTVYDEAEYAAQTIRKLVREDKTLRYRDIVIIARDTAPYEEAVISACKKNDVGCFVDKRQPLSSFPPVAAALSAIKAVSGFSTGAILRFYKTGLCGIDSEKLSKLENYTYIWNIDGRIWESDWDMNPAGFVSEEMSDRAKAELAEINQIRKAAIEPFINFKKNFTGSTAERAAALVELFKACNSKDALIRMKNAYNENGDAAYADALSQSWDIFMSLLNSMVCCMGDGSVTAAEFTNILKSSVSFSSIGITPQMLDEVTFGAADRIRPSRPKIAFILGANQNIFPRTVTGGGLLANSERNILISSGIEISDHSISEALDEEFLVYTNVCCPTEKLYICYHSMDSEYKEAAPAAFVDLICENTECKKDIYPAPLDKNNAPETAEAAFTQLCRAINGDIVSAYSISAALNDMPEYKKRIEQLENGYLNRDNLITEETAQKLFGDTIKMSPSKLDTFMRCSFSFFCKYGLKARRLQPAEFDVMQRGTIVHYVLQRIIEEYKKDIIDLSEKEISYLVDKYIDEYLSGITGYKSIENARLRYLVYTIARSLKEVVLHIAREFAQSGFEPQRCELKIGGDEVPCPETELPDNKKILVEGIVDRVDTWNGYVRIVDYKTGSRKFKLPDILVGQNMQMLIYLYAIVKKGKFADNKPAGIFYMPSKRDLRDTGMRMDGLAVLNNDVASAMEAENAGEYVTPLKYTKTGEILSYYKNSFISEEDFDTVFRHIDRLIYKMGCDITKGKFAVNPVDGIDSPACKYCDFAALCGIEGKSINSVAAINNSEVISILKERETDGV